MLLNFLLEFLVFHQSRIPFDQKGVIAFTYDICILQSLKQLVITILQIGNLAL